MACRGAGARARTGVTVVSRAEAEPRADEVTSAPRAAAEPRTAESACVACGSQCCKAQRAARALTCALPMASRTATSKAAPGERIAPGAMDAAG